MGHGFVEYPNSWSRWVHAGSRFKYGTHIGTFQFPTLLIFVQPFMFYNMYLVLSEECCRFHTALGEGQNSEMCQYKEHLTTHVFQEGQLLSHHTSVLITWMLQLVKENAVVNKKSSEEPVGKIFFWKKNCQWIFFWKMKNFIGGVKKSLVYLS